MRKFGKCVRKIGPKHSSYSGVFVSKKNNSHVQYESALERDMIYLLEFDETVKIYVEQPLKIEYYDKTKVRTYTPDFLIRYHEKDRNDEIIEIKYDKDIKSNFDKYKLKFDNAKLYCDNNYLTFNILTEKNIRNGNENYLKNIRFLFQYKDLLRSVNTNGVDIEKCNWILNHLDSNEKITIANLLGRLDKSQNMQAQYLYYIWFLIANYYIECNLKNKLSLNELIWV